MKRLSLIICILLVAGCAAKQKATKTSLQLQSFQAKEFETNKKTAFAAVLSVFQDLGYIIGSADFETGFITAKSPTKSKTRLFDYMMETSKATAFVEQLNNKHTKIRLNFVNNTETSSGYGAKKETEVPLEDPKTYENAFTKIQEAIFIRSGTK